MIAAFFIMGCRGTGMRSQQHAPPKLSVNEIRAIERAEDGMRCCEYKAYLNTFSFFMSLLKNPAAQGRVTSAKWGSSMTAITILDTRLWCNAGVFHEINVSPQKGKSINVIREPLIGIWALECDPVKSIFMVFQILSPENNSVLGHFVVQAARRIAEPEMVYLRLKLMAGENARFNHFRTGFMNGSGCFPSLVEHALFSPSGIVPLPQTSVKLDAVRDEFVFYIGNKYMTEDFFTYFLFDPTQVKLGGSCWGKNAFYFTPNNSREMVLIVGIHEGEKPDWLFNQKDNLSAELRKFPWLPLKKNIAFPDSDIADANLLVELLPGLQSEWDDFLNEYKLLKASINARADNEPIPDDAAVNYFQVLGQWRGLQERIYADIVKDVVKMKQCIEKGNNRE